MGIIIFDLKDMYIMKKLIAGASLLLSVTATVHALDCGTTTLTHEKIYCSSQNLQVLASKMMDAYSVASRGGINARQLQEEQQTWLTNELRVCITEQCMEQAYTKRIAQLQSQKPSATSARLEVPAVGNSAQVGTRNGEILSRNNEQVGVQQQQDQSHQTTQNSEPPTVSNDSATVQVTTASMANVDQPKDAKAQTTSQEQTELTTEGDSLSGKLMALWSEAWFYLQFVYALVMGFLVIKYFDNKAKAVVVAGNGNRIVRNGSIETLGYAFLVFVMAYASTYGLWMFLICTPIAVFFAWDYAVEDTGLAFCKERNTLEIPVGFKRLEIPVSDIKGTSGDLTVTHQVKKDPVGNYQKQSTFVWTLTIKMVGDYSHDIKFRSRQTYELARDLVAEIAGLS